MTARKRAPSPRAQLLRQEAEMLKLCGKLTVISGQIAALCRTGETMEEEEATEPALLLLETKRDRLLKRLRARRPSSEEGWTAYARAASLDTFCCGREVITPSEHATLIAWAVVAHVAGIPIPGPI